ncbi:hypothetical protein ACFSTH_17570 [Paenibacillus yanchengensis]|uniref:Uncharacterized protein n=1 Tax=Paenibacillus yanchengensis TaxID=2035833 RepID=A0ABW4YQN5_9BACL
MMIVKIKSEGRSFTIPVPYVLLRVASRTALSGLAQRILRSSIAKQSLSTATEEVVYVPNEQDLFHTNNKVYWMELVLTILENPSTKQTIMQLLKELQRCKGIVLVDVQTADRTEVKIIS